MALAVGLPYVLVGGDRKVTFRERYVLALLCDYNLLDLAWFGASASQTDLR